MRQPSWFSEHFASGMQYRRQHLDPQCPAVHFHMFICIYWCKCWHCYQIVYLELVVKPLASVKFGYSSTGNQRLSLKQLEDFKCYLFLSRPMWIILSSSFFSSVRSSNSPPDLLLTHPPNFSDLAWLPLYNNIGLSLSELLSYIKSNHWTHLLTTCIPHVQDSVR